MKVVKIDKAATDYYIKLTNLQSEYRRIGVNYNQAVKALHTGLSEKKALAMLYKLEQLTIELISLNREIIRLTQEFEQWLQNNIRSLRLRGIILQSRKSGQAAGTATGMKPDHGTGRRSSDHPALHPFLRTVSGG